MSATAFRRGEGDKRYSKWIETRRYWRGKLYVRTPTWLLGRVLGRPRWRDTLGTLLIRRKK